MPAPWDSCRSIRPPGCARWASRFGTNLRNDETNLRYGVFILSHLLYDSDDDAPADSANVHGSLRRGLLRYNGCVPRDRTRRTASAIPRTVRTRIDTFALSQCGWRGYERCVAQPLRVRARRLIRRLERT
jgi:hypothetical protein